MSSGQRLRLRLTAAQSGLDPRTHYWFKAGPGDYRRICDNVPWTRGHRTTVFHDVCGRCHWMRQDDQEHGLRVFSLTHRQMGVFARVSEDNCELDEDMTRPLSMLTFGKFYALDKADREKQFADREKRRRRQQQQGDGGSSGGPPYYSQLEKHLDKHHWATRNIDQLGRSDPILALESHDLSNPRNQTKLATYKVLQDKYVAHWRDHQASYFSVNSAKVWIGTGLCIQVDPEVGMQPGVSDIALPWVLKLWFLPDPPEPRTLDACLYLLGEGRRIGRWNGLAQLGVWDIRRSNLASFRLPDNIGNLVHDAADEYLALRNYYGHLKTSGGRLEMPEQPSRRENPRALHRL